MLEKEPMSLLVKKKELKAYKHNGFWQCMDTMRDKIYLNDILKKKQAKWI
jgi:glucose-1-phosphate cytidylyltransferase